MLNINLDANGKIKDWDKFTGTKRPLSFEMEEIKKTLTDYVESASGKGQGHESGWLTKIRRTVHHYNLYGRIVTKKSKGCSYFYELLNLNAKK